MFLCRQAGLKILCRQRRLEGIWAMGANECQGTPSNEELGGQEVRGALGGNRDLELRESAVSWNIIDLESTQLSISTTSGVLS